MFFTEANLLLPLFLRPKCFLTSSSDIFLLLTHQCSVHSEPSIQSSLHLSLQYEALSLQHHPSAPPYQHCWSLTRRKSKAGPVSWSLSQLLNIIQSQSVKCWKKNWSQHLKCFKAAVCLYTIHQFFCSL